MAPWSQSPAADDGVFVNEPRSRRSEPAMGGGSKIWKLMKRISTGALKDKYDRGPRTLPPIPPLPPMPLPPVPQLPKDYKDYKEYSALETRSAMSSDGHGREEPGALSRFMQSRPSISTSRPALSGSGVPRPAAATRSLPMPPPIPASSHQPRASTTTRSSSPVSSSDVASSKFFHRTTGSARSSTSSYGDENPPPPMPMPGVPNLIIGKHIVPPKDLYKLDLNALGPLDDKDKKVGVKPMAFFGTQNLRAPEDWTIVNTPAEEKPPSLPHPPRRLPVPNSNSSAKDVNSAVKEKDAKRLSQTPSIPEFSTAAPINAFAARKPADKPRVETMLAALAPAQPRRSTGDVSLSRQVSPAASTGSTARQKRMQQRSASLPRVAEPITFRDMAEKASAGQAPLTEKEKAERWEDLLERSDRAGGTIHLGASERLASDEVSVRYSTSSTQLLNDF
ncbi:hypothetical protein C8R44DRAFT_795900 [Mycena epipterygia]|nr:hypothetical protein C8R44DRAFT_795900 [Mycena epipterygia]